MAAEEAFAADSLAEGVDDLKGDRPTEPSIKPIDTLRRNCLTIAKRRDHLFRKQFIGPRTLLRIDSGEVS
jgi:hypothetical protein